MSEDLIPIAPPSEEGPFTVNVVERDDPKYPEVRIESDDFTHDVSLIVVGDFWSREQKIDYAEMLSGWLTKSAKETQP
jgi:hypothetical protein